MDKGFIIFAVIVTITAITITIFVNGYFAAFFVLAAYLARGAIQKTDDEG